MNSFTTLHDKVITAIAGLQQRGVLPAGLDLARVGIDPPRDPSHGDAATNAAMVLARPVRMKPMDIAIPLAEALLADEDVEVAEVAPPGFVNLRLAPSFWHRQIASILAAGEDYGRSDMGQGEKVNVEFCSANPTGPLHVGHARGTVIGDALASLLSHAGFAVTREYYVNDGGAQIEALGRSIHHRYREVLGDDPGPLPDGFYPLVELVDVARKLAGEYGDRYLNAPESEWLELFGLAGADAMLERIRDDLAAAGVHHDRFSSERELISQGKVDAALAHLDRLGLIYEGTLPPPKGKPDDDWEPVPQLLFRSTEFGDDIDRPLKRSTGAWTYFAADFAYHLDKYNRGFARQIDVWGADHGGYVKRMQAAVRALSEGKASLEVLLCRLVNLFDGGEPLRMSKRAGRIVWMRDVVDEVGKDAFRFMMLTRKSDAPLDFDLQKVIEQSRDNPVFYVQYAHARICSVFRNAEGDGLGEWLDAPPDDSALAGLADDAEMALLRRLALFPRTVESAAAHLEPHRVAFYLHDVASDFHTLWTRGKEQPELRFLRPDDRSLTVARLALLKATQLVLRVGMGLMGVTPVEEMH
ncbi:MAG: arginine--tRNA ligase [Geminicoccaceae bacterium]|nr:arginine--tRNA ligase [Geminicoccaceae bacterium]